MATGVLVDANVLYSRALRDWLFLLRNETRGGMFTVYATEDVLAETIYSYRRKHPRASGAQIGQLRTRLIQQLDDVFCNYEIDGTFRGNDPHDAHVHAAAVASGADVLLTCDRGFMELSVRESDDLPYEVYTPDSFFELVDDASAEAVIAVTREQLHYWYQQDGEVDLPLRLREADCPNFARRVSQHINQMTRTLPGL